MSAETLLFQGALCDFSGYSPLISVLAIYFLISHLMPLGMPAMFDPKPGKILYCIIERKPENIQRDNSLCCPHLRWVSLSSNLRVSLPLLSLHENTLFYTPDLLCALVPGKVRQQLLSFVAGGAGSFRFLRGNHLQEEQSFSTSCWPQFIS